MTSKTQETMKASAQLNAVKDENTKLLNALKEQYKYHLQFVSESSVPCDEMEGYLEHNWQQFLATK